MERKGLIQIYTGEGKGKTTAAVGLACRAVGHNLKVCYICFHKNQGRLLVYRNLGWIFLDLPKNIPIF